MQKNWDSLTDAAGLSKWNQGFSLWKPIYRLFFSPC